MAALKNWADKNWAGWLAGSVMLLASLAPLVGADSKGTDDSPASRIANAGRILIGVPPKDVDVAGGEQFVVEIKSVLRGAGTTGKPARITNSGNKSVHPRYKAGKQYLFLLTRSADEKGWLNSGESELPIENDKVRFLKDGKPQEEIALAKLAEMASGVETGATRDSLPGKWILYMGRQGTDIPVVLIDITKDDKKGYQSRLVEAAQSMGATTLKESTVTDAAVRIVLLADEEVFDFRGRFDAGRIRGTLSIPSAGMVATAWLSPTDAGKLPNPEEARKSVGRDEFVEAASQENEAYEPLQKFVRRYSDSPMVIDAYQMLIQLGASQNYDAARFKKLADEYLQVAAKWGPVLEAQAYIDLGLALSRSNVPGNDALEYLRTAEKKLTDDSPGHWNMLIQTEIGTRMLATGQVAEGTEFLKKLHEQYPFEGQLTWMLAQISEHSKDIDGAISLYADVVALPMMEQMVMQSVTQGNRKFPKEQLPSRVLARLWTEKNGDTKGLEHFLDETYEKRLSGVADATVAPRKPGEGNRVVLCELLTGSSCPPCVGADVATVALEATYQKSEVIVLRYHQHSPAPDPLANDDTAERFSSYDAEGTPMIYVNGKLFPGAGGFMPQVPEIYRRLRKVIDPFLAEKTNLKLDLSAKSENGKIAISARASGVQSFPEDVHLRLVLAEDKVEFRANNGIRYHEMIVRSMPGGSDGIEPEKGKLAYEGDVDLAKLKTELVNSLTKIETRMVKPFDSKPLDLKALHLIAFLQNDDTGEVLQAAAIPVAGSTKVTAESPKAPAGKAARSKAPSGSAK